MNINPINGVAMEPVWLASPIITYSVVFGVLMCLVIILVLSLNKSASNAKKQKGIKICGYLAIILLFLEAIQRIAILVHNTSL